MQTGKVEEEELEMGGGVMPRLGDLVVFAKDLDAFGAKEISSMLRDAVHIVRTSLCLWDIDARQGEPAAPSRAGLISKITLQKVITNVVEIFVVCREPVLIPSAANLIAD
jgi:hypothetical protein